MNWVYSNFIDQKDIEWLLFFLFFYRFHLLEIVDAPEKPFNMMFPEGASVYDYRFIKKVRAYIICDGLSKQMPENFESLKVFANFGVPSPYMWLKTLLFYLL